MGAKASTAANTSLVAPASPAFMFMFGAWLLGERVSAPRVLALVLASVEVVIVVDPRQAMMGSRAALGNLALLLATLTWGLYSLLVKQSNQNWM